jgi:hypothetical protein
MSDERITKAMNALKSVDTPEEALAKGKSLYESKPKARIWPLLLTAALTCGITLGVAIPVTSAVIAYRQAHTGSAGTGETDPSLVQYLGKAAKYHYGSSIDNLVADGMVYSELYYCFNDETTSIIAAHLDISVCQRLSVEIATGYFGSGVDTSSAYSSFSFQGFSVVMNLALTDMETPFTALRMFL